MNQQEHDDFVDMVRKTSRTKNLSEMVELLGESVNSLRSAISEGASSFEKNKDKIEKEIVSSKTMMIEMNKRLERISHSVDMITIHYAPIGAEIDGISVNDKEE